MIDFIKWDITHITEKALRDDTPLNWDGEISLDTGVINYPIVGHYRNMKIELKENSRTLSGSIHKLRNILTYGEGHDYNFNDFTYQQICETILHLKERFNLDLKKCIIQNLEIGLNIQPTFDPALMMQKSLIVFHGKTPETDKDYPNGGKYIDYKFTESYMKVYDKGKQQEQPEHILRIERKFMRNEVLRKKFGITTLHGLLDRTKIEKALLHLYESSTKFVIVDDLSGHIIPDGPEKEIFKKGINPMTWKSFSNGTAKMRFRDKFDAVLSKYQLNKIFNEITSKLKTKGKSLLGCYEMNDFQKQESDQNAIEMLRNEPYIYFHNVTPTTNEDSEVMSGQSVGIKRCIVTGIDISFQRDRSRFISKKKVMELVDDDVDLFHDLLERFGPKKNRELSLEDTCSEIAHNVRNTKSNKRHEVKRKIVKYENSMFPLNSWEIPNHL